MAEQCSSGEDLNLKPVGSHHIKIGTVRRRGGANGRMFAGFLIENYIGALIGLSESPCFGFGIVNGRGGCAPYQMAVLVGLEDVKGWNHVFNLVLEIAIRQPGESDTPGAVQGTRPVSFPRVNTRTAKERSGPRLLGSITPLCVP